MPDLKTKTGKKTTKQTLFVDERTNAEKVTAVIERIEHGETERGACRLEDISRSTFRTTALRLDKGDQYAKALYGLAQDQVEKIEQTIEDMRNGTVDAAMARVEIDTRKWFASKFLPRQYGDKIDVTSDGKELAQPIVNLNMFAELGKDTTNDIERTYIDGEQAITKLPENAPKTGLLSTSTSIDTQNSGNIMEDINT